MVGLSATELVLQQGFSVEDGGYTLSRMKKLDLLTGGWAFLSGQRTIA